MLSYSNPPLQSLRILLTGALLTGTLLAEDTWYMMEVDNVHICSNAALKELEKVHRELHYFNRSMEILFQRKLSRMEDPFHALILRNKKDMELFYGDRADDTLGFLVGAPGYEISVVRADLPREKSAAQILYHELTHNNIAPFDPPLWQNEGFAMIFGTVEVGKKKIKVGIVDENLIGYMNYGAHQHPIGFADFFKVHNRSDHYRNRDKSTDYYAKAALFAHYCWFGNPELRGNFLKLGSLYRPSERQFRELMGCDYLTMERNLNDYAQRGRYEYMELFIDKLPPPPPMNIREATPDEVSNYQARVFAVMGKDDAARERLFLLPEDDLMAAETRWIMATRKESEDLSKAVEKARELGSTNPMLQVAYAWLLFEEYTKDKDPAKEVCLSDEQVGELLQLLGPPLRAPGRFDKSVELLVMISDAAWLRNPPQLMAVIERWDRGRLDSSKDEETEAALARVRVRAAGIGSAR